MTADLYPLRVLLVTYIPHISPAISQNYRIATLAVRLA
jgi:hypothetical protein